MNIYDLDIEKIKGFYVIFTKNFTSIKNFKKSIKDSLSCPEINFQETSKMTYNDIENAAYALPFMDSKRVIFSNVVNKDIKHLSKIGPLSSENAIFFIVSADKDESITNNKIVKAMKKLNNVEIINNIFDEKDILKILKKDIDVKLANILIEKCGLDLDLISSELLKIKFGGAVEDIIESEDNDIWKLINCISQKKIDSMRMLEELKEKMSVNNIFFNMQKQLQNMMRVKAYKSQKIPNADIAKYTKLLSWQVNQLSKQCNALDMTKLMEIVSTFNKIDSEIKTGKFNDCELDLAVLSLIK